VIMMSTLGDLIEIPVSMDDIRSIHNAYRYHLASLPSSTLRVSTDTHNNKLTHMLARYLLQKFLRHTQTPFSTLQSQGPRSDPAGKLILGGRSVRFFIRFTKEHDHRIEPSLTKHQVEQLTDADDINIFASFIRTSQRGTEHIGAYHFLPPLLEADRSDEPRFFIQTAGAPIELFGTDQAQTPIEHAIKKTGPDPFPIPTLFSRLAYLYTPNRPKSIVRLSAPPSTYIQISMEDWQMIGITAGTFVLSGWLPSFQLKRMISDRLSIDTEFRIRYFKTEKCVFSPAELRPLPRLFALAQQLDKGT